MVSVEVVNVSHDTAPVQRWRILSLADFLGSLLYA
jgi:hypothetical protein